MTQRRLLALFGLCLVVVAAYMCSAVLLTTGLQTDAWPWWAWFGVDAPGDLGLVALATGLFACADAHRRHAHRG